MIRATFFALLSVSMFIGCAEKANITPQAKTVAQKANTLPVVEMPADFGIEKWEGNRSVDTVVVHTAHSVEGEPYEPKNVYNIFKKYNVTSHYLIDRDGVIYRLASENDLAHHAGKSKMADGREGVNAFSIGIELINSKIDYPTKAQYTALVKLINDIKTRHKIEHIVGHKDIAPTRKTDPWNFDFNELAMLLENQKHAKEATK
ncbi:MAG: N-acetylmuramoyl-L-alanine amidase [Campylobacterales bacterium]